MATKLVNLTPHALVVYDESGKTPLATLEVAGKMARVKTLALDDGVVEIDGRTVPVVATTFGEVEDLPDPKPDTTYVVSILVVQALRGRRSDVVAPDTGPASVVRDGAGQILGVRLGKSFRWKGIVTRNFLEEW